MIARWRAKGCCRNSGYTELVRREIVRMGHAFFATAKSTDLVGRLYNDHPSAS